MVPEVTSPATDDGSTTWSQATRRVAFRYAGMAGGCSSGPRSLTTGCRRTRHPTACGTPSAQRHGGTVMNDNPEARVISGLHQLGLDHEQVEQVLNLVNSDRLVPEPEPE